MVARTCLHVSLYVHCPSFLLKKTVLPYVNAYVYVCMLRYLKMTTESSPRSAKNETPIQKKKRLFYANRTADSKWQESGSINPVYNACVSHNSKLRIKLGVLSFVETIPS
jgi:hypothetical protein